MGRQPLGELGRPPTRERILAAALRAFTREAFVAASGALVKRLEEAVNEKADLAANLRANLEAFLESAETRREAFRLITADHFKKVACVPSGTRLPKDVVVELLSRSKGTSFAPKNPVLASALVIGDILLRPIQFRLAGLIPMERETFLDSIHQAVRRLLEIAS